MVLMTGASRIPLTLFGSNDGSAKTFDGCAGLQPMQTRSTSAETAMSFFMTPILDKTPRAYPLTA